MLRPIELNAARYPWPINPDQGRFNDVVPVEKIVAVRLVQPGKNSSPDFRKHDELDEIIFKVHSLINLVDLVAGQPVRERRWINISLGALDVTVFKKHRVLISFQRRICGEAEILHPGLYNSFWCLAIRFPIPFL